MGAEKYKVKQGMELTVFGEEQILYYPQKNSIHLLNYTSAEILNFMLEPASIKDVVMYLQEKYGDIEDINDDVENIISEFLENEILELVELE